MRKINLLYILSLVSVFFFTAQKVSAGDEDLTNLIVNNDFELAVDANCNVVPITADMDGWRSNAWRPSLSKCTEQNHQFYGWKWVMGNGIEGFGTANAFTVGSDSQGMNKDADPITTMHGDWICWIGSNTFTLPDGIAELYQTINGLSAGTYKVQCRLAVGERRTSQRLFAKSNNNIAVQYHGTETQYASNKTEGETATFANWPNGEKNLQEMEVNITIEENAPLTIGIRTGNIKGDGTKAAAAGAFWGWFKTDYFRLTKIDTSPRPKIESLTLSSCSHMEKNTKTITVTVNTTLINNEKLLISLVDDEDNMVVNATEAVVSQDKAKVNFIIPASVPKGEYFVKVAVPNGKIGDINVAPKKVEYLITSSHFVGKNLITFGNSITAAQNSWAYQTSQKLGFANLYNGAVGGAIWYQRARLAQDGDSIWTQNYADLNFAGMSNETNVDRASFQRIINNCAVVHIQKYLVEKTNASPDYAILSYGTNDLATSTMGNVEQTMSKTLDEVDLFTMAGAIRWSIETLRTRFPNLVIYVALPIQAKDGTKNSDNIKKIKIIKGICDAMSVVYFDCFNESGITATNQATYLRDGLHPNESGQTVHAEYIIKKLEKAISSGQSSSIQKKVIKEDISISANVLNMGQNLSINSLTNEFTLSEVILYNIAGREIYRKSISGNEYTFQAPTTSGLYVMTVNLNNNTSKAFKILVK